MTQIPAQTVASELATFLASFADRAALGEIVQVIDEGDGTVTLNLADGDSFTVTFTPRDTSYKHCGAAGHTDPTQG